MLTPAGVNVPVHGPSSAESMGPQCAGGRATRTPAGVNVPVHRASPAVRERGAWCGEAGRDGERRAVAGGR